MQHDKRKKIQSSNLVREEILPEAIKKSHYGQGNPQNAVNLRLSMKLLQRLG